ncbi:maleylpyruvate isomerase family mycothiol-dependent enzyme [Nocardioides sp. Bht2]|uniref:maleylpyruvate isomerase family mycothiol-dependent enzyme n=1 Tax=Nocardioides sp. Bht2 TaxID=3392297 RepID=UPI0039B3F862
MSDAEELTGYIDIWWQSIDDFTRLVEELDPTDWARATDLPGWDVHAVVAHTAHLEALLVGAPGDDQVDIGEPEHVKNPMGSFTEQGVVARRDRTPDELLAELRESATTRHTQHLASPPTDADADAPGVFGAIGWSWRTLLRNRPLDVWMHEQDIRRAVQRPGNLDSPAAHHVVTIFSAALPVVVGKRVSPPAGTSIALHVEGQLPLAVRINDEGRAEQVAADGEMTARLHLGVEAFTVLGGGRRSAADVEAEPGAVTVEGDQELGRRVLEALAVTP